MTGRAIGIIALVCAILTAPLAAEAQRAGKAARIGILGHTDSPGWETFRQALRELGYGEGKNLATEWRWHKGQIERLPDLAAEFVRLKVDVIVVSGPQGTAAVKAATTTIPVVFIGVSDPVRVGIVSSLARPGGNVTGFTTFVPEGFTAKGLELLKEAVPKASRIAVLANPTNEMHRMSLEQSVTAADALKVRLQILEARGPDDLERAFEAATRERAEAIQVYADQLTFVHRARIAELAAKSRLPAIYLFREHVEAGGLMSYGPSLHDLFRRAGGYVDKILKGAKPADLPVQQPTKFDLVINLKTAKALGLTIPQSVLIRADEVIQ